MTFDWSYAWSILPLLLRATEVTIEATFFGMIVASVLGLVLALGRLSPIRSVHITSGAVVEIIRDTPLLIQLFLLYYTLPLIEIRLPTLETGIFALGLHYAAYLAETYRAGILSIDRGQFEAATALNLSTIRTWGRIILPQVAPRVLPVMGTFGLAMFKDTPLLFTIGVAELFGVAMNQAGQTYRYFEPIALVGLIFLALSIPSAALFQWAERRYGVELR